MTRSPTITDEALRAMHDRARAAGMDPYGSSPEQMVRISHVVSNTPDIANSWQDFWSWIGLDKLLTLFESSTHSSFEVSDMRRR